MTNETTASQPKSIGDDAQFLKLLTAVETAPRYSKALSEASAALIAEIDSRAPADQASATIQAGQWVRCTPDLINAGVSCGETPRRPNAVTRSHDHFIAHSATIQEPVIVAEPVGASGLSAAVLQAMYKAFHRGDTVERAHGAVMELVAAPMVADPAGVTAEMPAQWLSEVVGPSVDDLSYGQGYRAGWNDCRAKFIAYLATVKAVPSEALEDLIVQHRIAITPENEGGFHAHVYQDQESPIATGYGVTPRRAVDSALFDAPLADKTGGAA